MTCKDCPDRQLGCHDHCEQYLKFKAENDRVRQTMQADMQNNYAISCLRKNGVEQARRKGRVIKIR